MKRTVEASAELRNEVGGLHISPIPNVEARVIEIPTCSGSELMTSLSSSLNSRASMTLPHLQSDAIVIGLAGSFELAKRV